MNLKAPFQRDAFRFWVAILLTILAGDHTGAWDVDAVFAGERINVKDLTVIVSGVCAVITALQSRDQKDRSD